MDKDTRNAIQRATQSARALLEREVGQQLEGVYDIRLDGTIPDEPGAHLDAAQRLTRDKLVAAVSHHAALGRTRAEAVGDYLREAAFTTLNRFVALKMLEARALVQECISRGDQSSGFQEFCSLAPGLIQLPDQGYGLYLESLLDEIGQEVGILFDRRDPSSPIWPGRQALNELLELLNAQQLATVWDDDETIGWVYQYFNSKEERDLMRDVKRGGSKAPRNGHELAVRNQFFTPRYVVQFLVENTLVRLWLEMQGDKTSLPDRCEYVVQTANEPVNRRPPKDPRDLRVLDPACGSGHFLLYSFDVLRAIYEEAWHDEGFGARCQSTGRTLREDYADLHSLRQKIPALIVEKNLYSIEIDPRCAQIAALALWLRAHGTWTEWGIVRANRPRIHRTNVVVAEPIPGDAALVDEFAVRLDPPLLGDLFRKMARDLRLAGELGSLLRIDAIFASSLQAAREQYVHQQTAAIPLPGLEAPHKQGELDLSGIDDDTFFQDAEPRIVDALHIFVEHSSGAASVRRRLFADDAAQGVAFIDVLRTRFDVVLMNPPFGLANLAAAKELERAYPRTKNDLYAAFVERGLELLHPRGLLGAITSRTGFFLPTFQRWREDVLLGEAVPLLFADLGYGVLDSAMVEVAAYCLEKCSKAEV